MDRVMSYDEIAEAFGIARDSARKMVRRKAWARLKGNDGSMRIRVPEDSLPRPGDGPADNPGDSTGGDPTDSAPRPSDDPGDKAGPEGVAVLAMSRVIDALREELGELRPRAAERDAFAAEVNALRLILEAQRAHGQGLQHRIDDLRGERDAWKVQAERSASPAPRRWWWRRAG